MQCKKCYNTKNIKTLSGEFFKDCDGFEKYILLICGFNQSGYGRRSY